MKGWDGSRVDGWRKRKQRWSDQERERKYRVQIEVFDFVCFEEIIICLMSFALRGSV